MSRQYDVLVKKSVHFNLTKDSHTALKMACTARSLSMQEVIEAFAKRIEIEDNKLTNNSKSQESIKIAVNA